MDFVNAISILDARIPPEDNPLSCLLVLARLDSLYARAGDHTSTAGPAKIGPVAIDVGQIRKTVREMRDPAIGPQVREPDFASWSIGEDSSPMTRSSGT